MAPVEDMIEPAFLVSGKPREGKEPRGIRMFQRKILRVFSAGLRRSEAVTLGDPVMPVLDGLPG